MWLGVSVSMEIGRQAIDAVSAAAEVDTDTYLPAEL